MKKGPENTKTTAQAEKVNISNETEHYSSTGARTRFLRYHIPAR